MSTARPTGFVGTGDLVFSFSPGHAAEVPQPFRSAAATVRLLEVQRPRVLLLGFGLGAMAGMMLDWNEAVHVVGVEPDRRLLESARQTFHDQRRIELIATDALSYLRTEPGAPFDLILDDCFEMRDGEPRRPPLMNDSAEWVRRHLAPDGLAVRNLLPDDGTAAAQSHDLRSEFRFVTTRRFQEWENVLVLASDHELPEGWRRRLR